MFLDWILRNKYRKTSSRGRNSGGRACFTTGIRQLRVEPLERRALLSGLSLATPSHGPNTAAAQLVLLAPRSADVGVPVTAELAAVNSNGFVVTSFADSVTVASSPDTTAKVSSISFTRGIAFFTVTFDAAGTQTLTATDTAAHTTIPAATATTTVINPAVATQLALFVPRSAKVGVPVTVQLAALNAQNQVVQNFSDSVSVASSPDTTAKVSTISF